MLRWRDAFAPAPEHFLPERDLVGASRLGGKRARPGEITAAVLGPSLSFELYKPDWLPVGWECLSREPADLAHFLADREDSPVSRNGGANRQCGGLDTGDRAGAACQQLIRA